MSAGSTMQPLSREPGVINYLILCLCGLGAILLVLLAHGFGMWSAMLILVGLLGSATRVGPLVLPIALTLVLNNPPHRYHFVQRTLIDVSDLILCGGALAYVIGHYRLQSIWLNIFPVEPRRPAPLGGKPAETEPAPTPVQRAARLVTRPELAAVVISLPLCAWLAQVVWKQLERQSNVTPNPGLVPEVWQGILLIWVVGVVGLTVATGLDFWYRRGMTVPEALILLQDVLWQETRREQRRINRWLVWAKLRRRSEKRS